MIAHKVLDAALKRDPKARMILPSGVPPDLYRYFVAGHAHDNYPLSDERPAGTALPLRNVARRRPGCFVAPAAG
jgi:hypothetical protein